MSLANKIFYFILGVVFTGAIGWSVFQRPVEAVAPSRVEQKVTVLSQREIERMHRDIASLEKSIGEDRDFLTTKYTSATGKGSWSSQHAERRNTIEQGLPGRERRLQELRAQLQTLRM